MGKREQGAIKKRKTEPITIAKEEATREAEKNQARREAALRAFGIFDKTKASAGAKQEAEEKARNEVDERRDEDAPKAGDRLQESTEEADFTAEVEAWLDETVWVYIPAPHGDYKGGSFERAFTTARK